MKSMSILLDVWCDEVSGCSARCLVLCQWLPCQMSGVMSVAALPDVWYYEVSGSLSRCLVYCQWLSWLKTGVMRLVATLEDVWSYKVSCYPERCLVLFQWQSWHMSRVMRSVGILKDIDALEQQQHISKFCQIFIFWYKVQESMNIRAMKALTWKLCNFLSYVWKTIVVHNKHLSKSRGTLDHCDICCCSAEDQPHNRLGLECNIGLWRGWPLLCVKMLCWVRSTFGQQR